MAHLAGVQRQERLAADFAHRFGTEHAKLRDDEDFWRRCSEHFSEELLADLALSCALWVGMGRMLRTLDIGQACKLDLAQPRLGHKRRRPPCYDEYVTRTDMEGEALKIRFGVGWARTPLRISSPTLSITSRPAGLTRCGSPSWFTPRRSIRWSVWPMRWPGRPD